MVFKLQSKFKPAGDQPKAIAKLNEGLKKGLTDQVLLGVTGSGKTFTAANVIANIGKPTLVIAHNKTLAAQLATEYKEFFPENAVHYFVSYYDYYQPEAYMPTTDTYIEKDAQINEEIDRLRHASTQALLTRKDVIIVASVSCIYGLGNPEEYEKENMKISRGTEILRNDLLRKLVSSHYTRTTVDLSPGQFRATGTTVEIMPVSERFIYSLSFNGAVIESIQKIDSLTRTIVDTPEFVFIFPAKHFITPGKERERAFKAIQSELKERIAYFEKKGLLLEADRIKRRTSYDLAMINEIGYCSGIENYSRHLSGRTAGEPPDTLLSYFPHTKDGRADFLTIIDESHVTVPQLRGMYAGDESRKKTLVEHGFRLPSAMDNRPLKFNEFLERIDQVVYTSATPGPYETEKAQTEKGQTVEQIIRPTGLLDPEIEVRPVVAKAAYPGQIEHAIGEIIRVVGTGDRAIVTTLTKKMAEELATFLKERGIKAEYLHSEIKTLERIKILTDFRRGNFDCLVGVNLLREGLDLPEVSWIGILDADKEGFLRSITSLIQIIGRAARNVNGRVVLYADRMTKSLEASIGETNRRRTIQTEYNKKHGITPATIRKTIKDITEDMESGHEKAVRELLTIDKPLFENDPIKLMREKRKQMEEAVKTLDFETAAILRDEIRFLEEQKTKKKS